MGLLHSLLKFSIGMQASGKISITHRKYPRKLTYLYQKHNIIAILKHISDLNLLEIPANLSVTMKSPLPEIHFPCCFLPKVV